MFFGIEDTQKWVTTINDAKSSYLKLLSKKEQQEAEREEYQKQLAVEKEKLTAYRNDEISADEFKKWFMDDEWMKLN